MPKYKRRRAEMIAPTASRTRATEASRCVCGGVPVPGHLCARQLHDSCRTWMQVNAQPLTTLFTRTRASHEERTLCKQCMAAWSTESCRQKKQNLQNTDSWRSSLHVCSSPDPATNQLWMCRLNHTFQFLPSNDCGYYLDVMPYCSRTRSGCIGCRHHTAGTS